jgi:hypothetical protein
MQREPSGSAYVPCAVIQPFGWFPEASTRLRGDSGLTVEEQPEIMAASTRMSIIIMRVIEKRLIFFLPLHVAAAISNGRSFDRFMTG